MGAGRLINIKTRAGPLAAWRRERFAFARFLPLAVLLVWAAFHAGDANLAQAGAVLLIALALLAQFRLWDDLVDRERDRTAHPQRVVARVEERAALNGAVCLLAASNALGLAWVHGLSALLGFALLCALTALWYRSYRARELTHVLVLHLKYPAFVLIIAPAPVQGTAPLIGAAIVYAAVLGFELLEEPRLRSGLGGWLLAGCLSVLTIAPFSVHTSPLGVGASALAGAVLFAKRHELMGTSAHPTVRYLPFALAAFGLTFATIGGFR